MPAQTLLMQKACIEAVLSKRSRIVWRIGTNGMPPPLGNTSTPTRPFLSKWGRQDRYLQLPRKIILRYRHITSYRDSPYASEEAVAGPLLQNLVGLWLRRNMLPSSLCLFRFFYFLFPPQASLVYICISITTSTTIMIIILLL